MPGVLYEIQTMAYVIQTDVFDVEGSQNAAEMERSSGMIALNQKNPEAMLQGPRDKGTSLKTSSN